MTDLYNATVHIVRRRDDAMVVRVQPDAPRTRFLGGQYGSLGLLSDAEPDKLIKRPYSVSSPIVDRQTGRAIDWLAHDYYEFYFNRVGGAPTGRERLTPKLFRLEDGDRIFCGQKITGHYTLDRIALDKDLLLISSTTGEAANNSIAAQWLLENRPGRACSLHLGPKGWQSLYLEEHALLVENEPRYRSLALAAEGYAEAEGLLEVCAGDPAAAARSLGFRLDQSTCHVFLCGDPDMIGAPRKLGAWNYEKPPAGLMQTLERHGFSVRTKFKQGNMDYETYW